MLADVIENAWALVAGLAELFGHVATLMVSLVASRPSWADMSLMQSLRVDGAGAMVDEVGAVGGSRRR